MIARVLLGTEMYACVLLLCWFVCSVRWRELQAHRHCLSSNVRSITSSSNRNGCPGAGCRDLTRL
jgi:hypothetical protein